MDSKSTDQLFMRYHSSDAQGSGTGVFTDFQESFGSRFADLFKGEDQQLALSGDEGGGSKWFEWRIVWNNRLRLPYCFKREAHLKDERARQSRNGPFPNDYHNGKRIRVIFVKEMNSSVKWTREVFGKLEKNTSFGR